MAQSANSPYRSLKEVVVRTGSEVGNGSRLHDQLQINPTPEASLETGSTEPTRLWNREFSNPKKGASSEKYREEEQEEEVTECSSYATSRRNARMFISRTKTRLEDPNWMYDRMASAKNNKKDEDWFLDEDPLDDINLKKLNPLTVIQWVSLVLLLATLACTLSIRKLKERTLWDLPLYKWEIVIFVIICGHLVSGWGIRIIVFFVESNFLLKTKVLYFVYGMRNAVQNFLWLGLVLMAWHFIVAENTVMKAKSKVLPHVTKILVCFLMATLLWLVKTLIVKVLASSFHVSAFFDRIKVSLFKQYMIKKLDGSPICEERSDQDDERDTREVKHSPKVSRRTSKRHEESNILDCLQQVTKKNVSALRMRRMMSVVQSGVISNLSTLDEGLPDSTDEDEASLRTRDESEAKALAKKIFSKVAKQGSNHIYLDDLKRFIQEDKVSQAWKLFEGAMHKGKVSEPSFTCWMVEAFKERRTLALSLDDTNTAVDDLHHMLDVISAIFIVIIWLLIFGIAITHFLVLISSQLLLAAFVFGNTCKTIFESMIFLFIMHPYDVGDRCEVDGIQMVVDEMNILTTVFLRYDQQKIVYPNSVLATKPIGNYNRSPGMGDQIKFSVHISTPWKKIEEMKNRIIEYIRSRNDHWHKDPTVFIKDVEDMNRLIMVVWPRHKSNHNNMVQRWTRRSLLIEEMIKVFRDLNIEYRMLPLDTNVLNMPGLTSNRLPCNWTTCAVADQI